MVKFLGLIAGLLLSCTSLIHAQLNKKAASEVYLSFQYQGVVSNYITAYYVNNQFYLPVNELFNLLKISHEVHQGSLSISGNYLNKKSYVFNFNSQEARAGAKTLHMQPNDFLIKEVDYFVKPVLFKKLFGLTFATDFNNLTLDLQTEDKMPVITQYERKQKRKKLDRNQPLFSNSHYPIKYHRDYSALDGAFLDYNVSGVYTNNSRLLTFNNSLGAEFLTGDVQGNIYGLLSEQQSSVTTNGLRWRYVKRDNNLFSSAIAGQTQSEGIRSRAITGVRISNKPVEPRLLFDRYVIDGNVTPQSEVELYLNNSLVDYQKADQSGHYRFVVPLTYGSTNYSVHIYTPSGQSSERNARIHIPFDYVPSGRVDYTASFGRLSNPVLGSSKRGYIGSANVSAGISKWLTAQASTEYLTQYHDALPSFTGTLNARLFSNYLVSASANSENFYQFSSSVVYSSGASWNLTYNYNPGHSVLYNTGGSDHRARVNLFTPFNVGKLPLNIRWSTTYQRDGSSRLLRYRADLNTRVRRLNIRLGYQDQQVGNLELTSTSSSRFTNSYTYSMGRYRSLPALVRGMFIRGQVSYLPGLNEFEEADMQISRDIFQTGRAELSFQHNFIGDFNALSLNFTFDFQKVRTNTSVQINNTDHTITQRVRGSIGFDPYNDDFLFTNRQQVGQAGVGVRLFVDKNNNGTFEDSTDKVISDPAVRLGRSGGRTEVKDGINYISQLLPYYRYDLEINKSAVSNPLLVPNIENFSIITDPNQYKTIEVPFYQSGVISGKVEQKQQNGESKGLSGVKVYLESNYDNTSTWDSLKKEMRTFSDGSFYTYKVPPGKYNLFIDPNQLQFLDAAAKPDTMAIEVEAKAQGDFLENLNFSVVSQSSSTNKRSKDNTDKSSKQTQHQQNADRYEVQVGSFSTYKRAHSFAQESSKKFKQDFNVIQNSNNGLFAVRSSDFKNRSLAQQFVIKIQKTSDYADAALLITNQANQDKTETSAKTHHQERNMHFTISIWSKTKSQIDETLLHDLRKDIPEKISKKSQTKLIISNLYSWKRTRKLHQYLKQQYSSKLIPIIVLGEK